MKYKKSIIMLVLAIFIFSVASVSASDVNDTAIASTDDSVVELSQADAEEMKSFEEGGLIGQTENIELMSEGNSGTFYELQVNINSATEGSTLTLNKNYGCEDGFNPIGISIDKSITIDGNGSKIDAHGKARIFNIMADNVILTNIIFMNGNSKTGGTVHFEKSGTVSNCTFTGNTAAKDGGAVYFRGTGEVSNCTFTNNSATDNGGAVYFNSEGEVTNCNFNKNTATGTYSYGGAVYFRGTGEVSNCTFTNNSVNDDGGAVYFWNSGEVTNCTFINNYATGTDDNLGGAIYMSSGNVTDCNFIDNKATVNGGAVYFANNGNVTDCNFTNNTAFRGGAIYFADNTGNVTNCNFKGNTTDKDGGAMYRGTATNCIFSQ